MFGFLHAGRRLRSSNFVASLAVFLCFSFAGQAEAIQHQSRESTGAGHHHYIVQPRSSRVTTRGRLRTGHAPSGGVATAMHTARSVSRPQSTSLSPHHAGGEGRFDLGCYANGRVRCMTAPSRSALIARPLRSNTFSMGTFSERTSAMNSRSPASRPRVARWRINAEPMPRP
jgi:hypothetical protein